jgi:hypothetical protein
VSESIDPVIEQAARTLRRPVRTDPAGRARLMEAVRQAPAPARAPGAWRWLVRPRPIMISPLAGLALAAGVMALAVLRPTRTREAPAAAGAAAAAAPSVTPAASGARASVQFVFVAPNAASVSLVGSFNGWDAAATPLRPTAANGVWMVLVPLEPGRHLYAFVVDGTHWIADPSAPRAPEDDFGVPNSVVMVGESST